MCVFLRRRLCSLAASTPFARRRSAPCSSQTILFTRTMVPEIIGPKVCNRAKKNFFIFQKQRSPLIAFSRAGHYTEGAELVDQVMDVVRREAEVSTIQYCFSTHHSFPFFFFLPF